MQLYKMTMKNGDVYWVISYSMEEGKARIEEMCFTGANYASQADRTVVKIEIIAEEIQYNSDNKAVLYSDCNSDDRIMDDMLIVDHDYTPYWEKKEVLTAYENPTKSKEIG